MAEMKYGGLSSVMAWRNGGGVSGKCSAGGVRSGALGKRHSGAAAHAGGGRRICRVQRGGLKKIEGEIMPCQ